MFLKNNSGAISLNMFLIGGILNQHIGYLSTLDAPLGLFYFTEKIPKCFKVEVK